MVCSLLSMRYHTTEITTIISSSSFKSGLKTVGALYGWNKMFGVIKNWFQSWANDSLLILVLFFSSSSIHLHLMSWLISMVIRAQSLMTAMIMMMISEITTQLRFPCDDTNSNRSSLAHSWYGVVCSCFNLKHGQYFSVDFSLKGTIINYPHIKIVFKKINDILRFARYINQWLIITQMQQNTEKPLS